MEMSSSARSRTRWRQIELLGAAQAHPGHRHAQDGPLIGEHDLELDGAILAHEHHLFPIGVDAQRHLSAAGQVEVEVFGVGVRHIHLRDGNLGFAGHSASVYGPSIRSGDPCRNRDPDAPGHPSGGPSKARGPRSGRGPGRPSAGSAQMAPLLPVYSGSPSDRRSQGSGSRGPDGG